MQVLDSDRKVEIANRFAPRGFSWRFGDTVPDGVAECIDKVLQLRSDIDQAAIAIIAAQQSQDRSV